MTSAVKMFAAVVATSNYSIGVNALELRPPATVTNNEWNYASACQVCWQANGKIQYKVTCNGEDLYKLNGNNWPTYNDWRKVFKVMRWEIGFMKTVSEKIKRKTSFWQRRSLQRLFDNSPMSKFRAQTRTFYRSSWGFASDAKRAQERVVKLQNIFNHLHQRDGADDDNNTKKDILDRINEQFEALKKGNLTDAKMWKLWAKKKALWLSVAGVIGGTIASAGLLPGAGGLGFGLFGLFKAGLAGSSTVNTVGCGALGVAVLARVGGEAAVYVNGERLGIREKDPQGKGTRPKVSEAAGGGRVAPGARGSRGVRGGGDARGSLGGRGASRRYGPRGGLSARGGLGGAPRAFRPPRAR